MKTRGRYIFWIGTIMAVPIHVIGSLIQIYGRYMAFRNPNHIVMFDRLNPITRWFYSAFWIYCVGFVIAWSILNLCFKCSSINYLKSVWKFYEVQMISTVIYTMVFPKDVWYTGFMEAFSVVPYKLLQAGIIAGFAVLLKFLERKGKEK